MTTPAAIPTAERASALAVPADSPRRPTVRPRDGGPGPAPASLLSSLPPLALYIHVPWCVRKCPYCDFNSHELRGELPEQDYLAALRADLEQALPLIWGRQIVSVFIGGGTPSLLSARAVDEIISLLRAYLNIWPEIEITMEANPGTAEASRFKAYAASGVNRLSLGIQSFDDAALKALGRIHDSRQAHSAIDMALAAFGQVNLDIMYALPEQTLAQCRNDIEAAIAYGTAHLSIYHLTLEPNTFFAKYPPAVPDDDTSAAMQDMIVELTDAGGWQRYEVSAYARADARSIHNVNYWEFGDYLGIGPGAHGKLSFPDRVIRQVRIRNPVSWVKAARAHDGSHVAQEHRIRDTEFPFEFMLNALRLRDGVPASYYPERTGQSLHPLMPTLAQLRKKGLLVADPLRLQATDLGWRFLNDLQAAFLD